MGQKKLATRSAQWPLLSEFVLNFDDTMVDINGVLQTIGKFGGTYIFDIVNLPAGAIIQGGEVVTEVAFVGSTAFNVTLGDSVNAARYLAATDKTALGRTVIVPTGYVGQGENLRATITPTVANATAGKTSVRVWYSIRDRANETIPN